MQASQAGLPAHFNLKLVGTSGGYRGQSHTGFVVCAEDSQEGYKSELMLIFGVSHYAGLGCWEQVHPFFSHDWPPTAASLAK